MSAPTRPTITTLDDVCDLVFTFEAPGCFGLVHDGPGYAIVEGPHLCGVGDLIGFTAPVSWSGIAFVGDGRGIHLDHGTEQRVRITFALARDGSHASTVHSPSGTDRLGGPGLAVDRPSGHLADLCHRALRMPAAPEPVGPDLADLARWLSDVLSAHEQLGPDLDLDDWHGLLSLHPRLGAPTTRTWDTVHQGLVDLGCGWGAITADEVAWMDPPTWARYVLDEVPPLGAVLWEAVEVLPADIVGRILDVLEGPWWDRPGEPG